MRAVDRFIKAVVVIPFITTGIACSYEPLTISGTVVDETGNALSDVSVWACYSGWGWGKEEGYLVWDKETCSEAVQTDTDGMYAISFEGPVSSRLRARKEGWVQSDSYNTTHSRMVLIRSEDRSSRLRDAVKQSAVHHRKRKATENNRDYYCRVVLPENRPLRLRYQDEIIAVTPTILEDESQTLAMFAVQGSSKAVNAFTKELVLKIDGRVQNLSFSSKADDADCTEEQYFVEFMAQDMDAWGGATVDLLVPSVQAMFEVKTYTYPGE